MSDLERLSHFELIEKLGEGGMGAVYRARDVRLGRHVALKLLPTAGASDPKARARFLAEARAVSALEHPHICMLYEFDEADGQPFLAMQLVEGENLKSEIARGPLAEARVREVIGAVGRALEAAHAREIVHRDVKSDNILLGRDGAIKLADFGIARLAEGGGLTTTQAVVGTIHYLAPEQMMGVSPGPAADQFALAVVAYECLTGTLPFHGDNLAAVMYAITNVDPEPPSALRPGLSPEWDAVLARALAKDASSRYGSIAKFADQIERCGTSSPPAQAPTPAPSPPATPIAPAPTAAGAAAPRVAAASTHTGAPSLAVLYFENLSTDPESDYFCAGITEDILTDLTTVPGLLVASRNAVSKYRGKRVEVQQVATDLGVGAVVEGSVRRAANRVRISAQLIDAGSGFQMWADRYDRTLEDVFAVQEDIARAIAVALRGALTPAEAAEIQRGRPAEVAAYDLYLKGRDHYRRYTPADIEKALACFEQAVEVDTDYALAWAGIADCCAQMLDKGWTTDVDIELRGFAAAKRSITLDPKLCEGHKAEALLWRTRRDPERVFDALRRALGANPRFIPAIINLGQERLSAGDFAGGERAFRRAVDVDPAYGFSHLMLALLFFYTGRHDVAIEYCHRAQSMGESPFYNTYAYAFRAHIFAEVGDARAAERELAGGRAAGVPEPILKAAEALSAATSGDHDRASYLLGELRLRSPGESYGCELAAYAAGRMGDAAQAVHFLRAAEKIDERHWAYWRISPDLKSMRDTREFIECVGARGRRMVWPKEAVPLAEDDRAQFDDYSEATGVPSGDEIP